MTARPDIRTTHQEHLSPAPDANFRPQSVSDNPRDWVVARRPVACAGSVGRPWAIARMGRRDPHRIPATTDEEAESMRWFYDRRFLFLMAVAMPILLTACDEDDDHSLSTHGVINIIYAIGDVVLAILDRVL